jgi:hypothetical protein
VKAALRALKGSGYGAFFKGRGKMGKTKEAFLLGWIEAPLY